MNFLDLDALAQTPLRREPYEFLVLPNFVRPEAMTAISGDFPATPGPGSHPPSELRIFGAFKTLMDELLDEPFRREIEQKFDIDLIGRPTMYTVRGYVAAHDGKIHTDSRTKLITVLLYLNQGWEADGGRLRILRNGEDLDDYVAEVPPGGGVLLAFRRSDNSWHGHKPHSGPRRVLQLNWVTDQGVVDREQRRHRLSTKLKKAMGLFGRRGEPAASLS